MRKLLIAGLFILSFSTPTLAGFTGPLCGFYACEIAHPANCHVIGLLHQAACRDLLGTFLGHHNKACTRNLLGCAIDGPGIAKLEGLLVQDDCECDFGLKNGWYHYEEGTLVGPTGLKKCKAASHHCFGEPNFEQGFTLP